MGGSQLKRSHRTHAFNQPAGVEYGHAPAPASGRPSHRDEADQALDDLRRLADLEPDGEVRARLIGVPPAVEASWHEGRLRPVLRARRRRLARLVDELSR